MTANEVAAWSRRRSRLPRSAKEEVSLGKLWAGTCEQVGCLSGMLQLFAYS